VNLNKLGKYQKLLLSILFDALGYVSFIIPGFGEYSDIIWAPVSAYLMMKMYKGNIGKVAGIVSFIEEILPGFDIVPTFALTWIYTQVIKKDGDE